jgi:nucleoside phosphorylase
MGSQGVSGATLSVKSIIDKWNPLAVLMVGIAFGAYRNKQQPGDVLVAEHLIPYEQQRIGESPRFRSPVPPSSEKLLNRFRNVLDWKFTRPDGSLCIRHIGPLLSGEKLVDNKQFKDSLLEQYPNAIGGEMEGTGLWSAAQRAGKDWIIAKGVCDWADGVKDDRYQAMAAAAAVSLSHHVFLDPHVLDGL